MQKLLDGIVEFRRNVRPKVKERFARLALGQTPDCLFVACSDSRVVPNLFASTDPGDLFVVRNVGNLVPRPLEEELGAVAAGAAVEFATQTLGVGDIVVCGHSECGAMRALLENPDLSGAPHLRQWLGSGRDSLARMASPGNVGLDLAPHNQLSQLNVLQQLEHLRAYAPVHERLAAGTLRLHAWWFDIANAEVLAYDAARGEFLPIDTADVPGLPPEP